MCHGDWYVDDVLVCRAGKEYEIKDAAGEDNEGYCDILACEDGKILQTNWVEVAEYFNI